MKRIIAVLSILAAIAGWLIVPAFTQTSPFVSGCAIFPADNVWNTPIDNLPLDLNSSSYIASIGSSTRVHPDFGSGLWDGGPIGIPFNLVPGGQPRVRIVFDYRDESDPGPYAIPHDAAIEGGNESAGDRHVLVLDHDNCILYETWSTYPQPDGSWEAGSGAVFDLRSNVLRTSGWTSSDAAGLPILPGLVRYEEVAAGEINHALRFTAPRTRKEFIWPARHHASNFTSASYPPLGQRFRLRADFDSSDFSPQVQVILRALKKYGMILADNGSSWYISGAPDPRWNNDVLVGELRRVWGSDFEAVDESSLMLSPDSGQVRQASVDSQAPTVPTGLAATVVASNQIDLSWNASDDNVGVDGYLIYRDGSRIGATTSITYRSAGLIPSTNYTYRVAAYDAAGNISPQSTAVTEMTFPVTSTAFNLKDRVLIKEQTGIRSIPSESGTVIGTQPKGASGTVTGGPVYWSNQWWWSIDFFSVSDGWVTEAILKKISRPVKPVPTRSNAGLRSPNYR